MRVRSVRPGRVVVAVPDRIEFREGSPMQQAPGTKVAMTAGFACAESEAPLDAQRSTSGTARVTKAGAVGHRGPGSRPSLSWKGSPRMLCVSLFGRDVFALLVGVRRNMDPRNMWN